MATPPTVVEAIQSEQTVREVHVAQNDGQFPQTVPKEMRPAPQMHAPLPSGVLPDGQV